jgi:hypothetical protein
VVQRDSGRRTSTARPELTTEILNYFLRNPQAADSLEGVASWRLQGERIWQQVNDAGAALDLLVEQGFLLKLCSPVSPPLYRLNEAKRSEVEHFLQRSTTARKMRKNR